MNFEMSNSVYIYISSICYLVTVIAPIYLLMYKTVRRNYFWLRCILSSIIMLSILLLCNVLIDYLNNIPDVTAGMRLTWLLAGKYFVIFILSVFAVRFCFACNWWGAMYSASVGYCVQHISARIDSITEDFILPEMHWGWLLIKNLIIAALVFICFYFLVCKKIEKNSTLNISGKFQIIIALCVVGVTIFYNSFGVYYAIGQIRISERLNVNTSFGYGSLMFVYITSMMTAILALMLNLNIGYTNKIANERDNLKKIIAESKMQYESEKRNIELLNIKCHDLKHQLASMKGKVYEEQIEELTDIISIYDGSLKTGNEALDVIITQKNLYCNQHGIHFTCLLNGEDFNFIPPHELYALFCNAIDNAIEAVEKVEQEKRIIRIVERKKSGFLSVRIQNYCSGDIEFKDNLPVSGNKEEGHGYGMKSMQMIAEKYGGGISASRNDEIFILDIFF